MPVVGSLPLIVKLSPLFEPSSVTASAAWSLAPSSIVSEVTLEPLRSSTVIVSWPEPRPSETAWMLLAVRLPPVVDEIPMSFVWVTWIVSALFVTVIASVFVPPAALDRRRHDAGRHVHRDRVVAGAAVDRVVRAARRDDVVAVAAVQEVRRAAAVAAGDRVVARAAVDRDRRVGAVVDDVVAVGAAVDADRAARVRADDDHVAAGAAGERGAARAVVEERVVPVAAVEEHGREHALVDDDRVVADVAGGVDLADVRERLRVAEGGRSG